MDSNITQKLDTFFNNFRNKKYKKREVLISSSDEPPGIFYLKEGALRQYMISSSGEEITLNIFKQGAFFPVAWALNDTANSHTYESITPVNIFIAPKKEFLEFITKNPDILLDLLKRIYRGLEGYFLRIESFMLGNARTKLITELFLYAKRFGQDSKNGIVINLKLTEKDLASLSGIARETVSREIQKLKQKGLIEFSNNTLVIKNTEKLEEELLNI